MCTNLCLILLYQITPIILSRIIPNIRSINVFYDSIVQYFSKLSRFVFIFNLYVNPFCNVSCQSNCFSHSTNDCAVKKRMLKNMLRVEPSKN